MKLLIIFTGGTIGSSVKDGYISVDADNITRLVDEAIDCVGEKWVVQVVNPYTILSETLNGTHIAALVSCINENITAYDGIIVCHGTDTLQYTAAALGFAFADSAIPIVVVSSNYVLDDSRANGRDNLRTAVEFITGRSKAPGLMNRMRRGGVWVSYKNTGEPAMIYEPFELLPHQPYDDSLYVMKHSDMAYGEPKEFYAADCQKMNAVCQKLRERSGILWIKAYPGMSYSAYIRDDKKPVSILLDTFHSGTINTADSELSELMHWAGENNIPVYLTGLEPGVAYETTRAYETLGIKPLTKMSPITAYVWIWIVTNELSEVN